MGSDGAAGLVLANSAKASALGLHVIAKLRGYAEAMLMQSRSFGSINLQLLFKNAPEECCFSFSAASSCFEASNHCPYSQLPCIIVNTISFS